MVLSKNTCFYMSFFSWVKKDKKILLSLFKDKGMCSAIDCNSMRPLFCSACPWSGGQAEERVTGLCAQHPLPQHGSCSALPMGSVISPRFQR